MKVALIQLNSQNNKSLNIQKAFHFAEQAYRKNTRFVLFPEYFYFRGKIDSPADLNAIAEPVDGPTFRIFSGLAKNYKGHVLLGSIYEKIRGQAKVYNTSILINPTGKIAGVYRKMHLFHFRNGQKEIREDRIFLPGKKLTSVSVEKFKVGMSVCFDVRFPELYETYAANGANVFTVPAAFSHQTGKAHWEILLRSRAAETFSYVLAPNQIGRNAQGVPCWGHSMIVDPWGKIIDQGSGSKEEIVYGELDLEMVKKIRSCFPNYKRIKH